MPSAVPRRHIRAVVSRKPALDRLDKAAAEHGLARHGDSYAYVFYLVCKADRPG